MQMDDGFAPNTSLDSPLTRRTMLARGGVALAAFSPALATLIGCGGGSSSAPNAGGSSAGAPVSGAPIDKLTWALAKAPSSMDVSKGFSGDAMAALYLVGEPLVTFDKDLALVPLLAEDVATPDPTTFVYTLRDAVTFSNGSPLTPEDVVFSIEHAAAKDSQVSYYFGNLEKVAKTGPREVTVTTKKPDVTFGFSLVYAPIIPKAYAQSKGNKLGAPGADNWVATGPYKVESFNQSSLVVVRNEDYWGDKPLVASVAFSWIADAQTLQLSVRSGQVDGTYTVSPPDADQWASQAETQLLTVPGLSVWFLAFNVDAEPWDDVHVRRAFGHAFNQEGIIKAVLGGRAGAAKVLVPANEWAGLQSADEVTTLYEGLPGYAYDLDKAKAELQSSAHASGVKGSVLVPDTAKYVTDALLAFAGDLKKVGVTLDVKTVPSQTWLDRSFAHKDLGITCMQWAPDYPDPSNYLTISYDSSGAVPNGLNIANFKDPQVDKLLAQQAATTDKAERVAALTEVLRIGQEQFPYLSMWWENASAAVNKEYQLSDFTPLSGAFTAWAQDVAKTA